MMNVAGEDHRGRSMEELSEGPLADLWGLPQAEARAWFIGRLRKPGLEVLFVAKEIQQWAAGLSHTAAISSGGPDDDVRRVSPLEHTAGYIHSHRLLTETTRRPNTRPLAQYERDT